MATPQELADAIVDDALDPVASASDGQSATGRPVADQILATKHAAAARAGRRRLRGVAITQLITQGPHDDGGRVVPFDQYGGW